MKAKEGEHQQELLEKDQEFSILREENVKLKEDLEDYRTKAETFKEVVELFNMSEPVLSREYTPLEQQVLRVVGKSVGTEEMLNPSLQVQY